MDNLSLQLAEQYEKVFRLGEELLPLLSPPIHAAKLVRIHLLIEERETAVGAAGELIARGASVAEAGTDRERLARQQAALEAAFSRAVDQARASATGSQEAQAKLQAVQRLLRPVSNSAFLNERR